MHSMASDCSWIKLVLSHIHTHIRESKQAKDLIFCAERYILPRRANKYFLVSLSRITDNQDYYDLLQDAINRTSNKKSNYKNKPKMR